MWSNTDKGRKMCSNVDKVQLERCDQIQIKVK